MWQLLYLYIYCCYCGIQLYCGIVARCKKQKCGRQNSRYIWQINFRCPPRCNSLIPSLWSLALLSFVLAKSSFLLYQISWNLTCLVACGFPYFFSSFFYYRFFFLMFLYICCFCLLLCCVLLRFLINDGWITGFVCARYLLWQPYSSLSNIFLTFLFQLFIKDPHMSFVSTVIPKWHWWCAIFSLCPSASHLFADLFCT